MPIYEPGLEPLVVIDVCEASVDRLTIGVPGLTLKADIDGVCDTPSLDIVPAL
jgi:hypothetical protein